MEVLVRFLFCFLLFTKPEVLIVKKKKKKFFCEVLCTPELCNQ